MPFQTKITKARFALGPFSSETMEEIGNTLLGSIKTRIQSGLNADDAPSKPLKPGRNGRRGYPDYKIGRGLQGVRDWTWTGRTLRSMKLLSVNENRGQIGFTDATTDLRAHVNNLREKAFAVSPNDRKVLEQSVRDAFHKKPIIQAKNVA